ncbi:hypothetical protein LshimejAT787_1103720 [Lyophyllum shimeji]|uniref:Uncharacterized protein n=1 Tax=Lyophyllum shimeji TaxID=47721 RepID=A0A9P3URL6_LYOSH|nr:hypothetical protein LshimejAT787_1103720 [Lyophyllum shimeji]
MIGTVPCNLTLPYLTIPGSSPDPSHDLKRAIAVNVCNIVNPTSGHESKGSAAPPPPEKPRPRGYVDPAAQGDSKGGKGSTKGPKATKRDS